MPGKEAGGNKEVDRDGKEPRSSLLEEGKGFVAIALDGLHRDDGKCRKR